MNTQIKARFTNKITFFLFFVWTNIFVLSETINAQNQPDLKPAKIKELAETAYLEGDTYTAIYFYELLLQQKPSSAAQHILVDLYTKSRDYEKAKQLLLGIINSGNVKSDSFLKLGTLYKQLGHYDSCIYYLDKCKKNKLDKIEIYRLKNEYQGAELALNIDTDTLSLNVNTGNLSINTAYMESAPYFINDSLIIYTWQVINDENLYSYNDTVSQPSSKLVFAQKKEINWVKTHELDELNNQFSTPGNGFISFEKDRLYFTQTIKNWHKKNTTQLYVCDYHKGQISNASPLDNGINDMYFSSTQPTIGNSFNPDLEIIYFSSDRPGGKGGMDIWYTVYNKKRGGYTAPINAGNRINTPLDEITPYYDFTSKTLYYSSNGLVGFGGFDIHKSVGELKSWTKPENIGNFLNSNADEIYFRLNPSRNGGFIVSNKPLLKKEAGNFCCFDLVYFTFRNPDQLLLKGNLLSKTNPIIDKILKSGVEFRDSTLKNNKYLKDAVISLYLKTEMGTDSIYITSDTTDINGLFEFSAGSNQEYALIIQEKEEVKARVTVSTKTTEALGSREIILDIKPIESLPDAPLIIKNIYYESGVSDLSEDAKKILDETLIELLQEIPNIKVEISSHTDDVGADDYNFKLSEKRAEMVAKYLTSAGISKNRLVTKGYGETQPIAPNQNSDGTDNSVGRERNRRTEFRIIGTMQALIGF
jgi:outer membrane protein OmpA-like peptidoglycan-associated protein